MCGALDFWDHRTHEGVEPSARSGNPIAGCAGGSRRCSVGESAMKTELPARSLLYVLLVALGCEMQPGGSATTARADESSAAIYPGRYAANCKPAPAVGCVCETDLAGSTRQIFQAAGDSNDHDRRIGGIEYLRMTEWLRATCIAVTRPGEIR